MKLIQRKLGPLDCLTSLNENENTSQKTATVFLHGAGANMHDLTGLTGFLPSLADKHVYFLDAPFSALPGSNMRLWFDVEELLFLMQSGKLKERFENGFSPKQFERSTELLKEALSSEHFSYSSIHLVGFSQGGMMAMAAASADPRVEKLGLLSTAAPSFASLEKFLLSKTKPSIFQAHGTEDEVLPFGYGEYFSDILRGHVADYDFFSFAGGHEIPQVCLEKLDSFLKKL